MIECRHSFIGMVQPQLSPSRIWCDLEKIAKSRDICAKAAITAMFPINFPYNCERLGTGTCLSGPQIRILFHHSNRLSDMNDAPEFEGGSDDLTPAITNA